MRHGAAAPKFMMCSEPVRSQRPRGGDVSSPEVIEGRDGGWDVSSQGSRVTRAWEVWRRDVSTPEPRTGAIGAGTSRPRKFWVARGGHGDETSPAPSWSALNCASLRASAVGFTMPPRARVSTRPRLMAAAPRCTVALFAGASPPDRWPHAKDAKAARKLPRVVRVLRASPPSPPKKIPSWTGVVRARTGFVRLYRVKRYEPEQHQPERRGGGFGFWRLAFRRHRPDCQNGFEGV
jgi:hypothetical protein